MSGRGRVIPALVAIATGVVSGVYIFQPLIIQERDKLVTLNQSPNATNNAPPNITSTISRPDSPPTEDASKPA
ncbi:unnamed protein product [Rhizoctonia solani]|nr:uncharacterized protein RhiXN_04405 [Rhizoctonia solani]QRW16404.1 hypothetical protein RhiXN_04405 [Rhizoctonia solani]CAE6432977.1 unnamed protein product [Rhizoctonia solani]